MTVPVADAPSNSPPSDADTRVKATVSPASCAVSRYVWIRMVFASSPASNATEPVGAW